MTGFTLAAGASFPSSTTETNVYFKPSPHEMLQYSNGIKSLLKMNSATSETCDMISILDYISPPPSRHNSKIRVKLSSNVNSVTL